MNTLEFSKNEIKDDVKWVKGYDFIDDTPRYTFEGRDPQNTLERFGVVIYIEREREYPYGGQYRNYYYGYVIDNEKECADTVGRYKLLKTAKEETLKLFNDYMRNFCK